MNLFSFIKNYGIKRIYTLSVPSRTRKKVSTSNLEQNDKIHTYLQNIFSIVTSIVVEFSHFIILISIIIKFVKVTYNKDECFFFSHFTILYKNEH